MATNTIEHGSNKAMLCLAWETFAQNEYFWKEGQQGACFTELLLKYNGREPCERLALYWHEHGRDDIAARIKQIIHQGEEKP